MVKKIKCTCKHDYQDKAYGKSIRIHNDYVQFNKTAGTKTMPAGWRCTVCGEVKK